MVLKTIAILAAAGAIVAICTGPGRLAANRVTERVERRVMERAPRIVERLAAAQDSRSDAPVRAVVARYVAARDAADEKALTELFTDDADQLVSSGEWRRGRAEVIRGTLASSKAASGARTIAVASVRFLSPDVAIADGPYEIAATQGSAARRMWTCVVLRRTSDGWRIAAIRNMLPATPAK